MNKKCTSCGQDKPLYDFCKKATSKDGRASLCKTCSIEKLKAWVAANPEKKAAAVKRACERRKADREKQRERSAPRETALPRRIDEREAYIVRLEAYIVGLESRIDALLSRGAA